MKSFGITFLIAALPVAALAACGSDGTRTNPAGTNLDRSPVSVVDYADRQAVADWALAQGLSGLSMASAGAAEPSAATVRYQDQIALVKYALEHGLSGLWAASLQPVSADETDTTAP